MVASKNILGVATSALLSAAPAVQAAYTLQDNFDASNFFDSFTFFTDNDPTHGFVDYVDKSTAFSKGLASADNGQIFMGPETTQTVGSAGRQSVRVTSNKSYNQGLFLMDATHMPSACGAWPAWWLVGPNWPGTGEIDVIEGVNSQDTNIVTLHTSATCQMKNDGSLSSTQLGNSNCNANNAYDGCGQTTANTNNYGAGFNQNQGGIYAMEWTDSAINVWFFARGSQIASSLNGNGGAVDPNSPDTSAFGTPLARFSPDSSKGGCDMAQHFQDHRIVFDLTFCGDWAGQQAVWDADATCSAKASTCQDFVQNNGNAFQDANFQVNYVKTFSDASTLNRTVEQIFSA